MHGFRVRKLHASIYPPLSVIIPPSRELASFLSPIVSTSDVPEGEQIFRSTMAFAVKSPSGVYPGGRVRARACAIAVMLKLVLSGAFQLLLQRFEESQLFVPFL